MSTVSRFFLLAGMCIIILTGAGCSQHSTQIISVASNGKQMPAGVETDNINFSWQLTSQQRNQYQTAYQIVVASTPSLLEDASPDIWDSGIRRDSVSVRVKYEGPQLKPGKHYYWRVRVWDKNDEVTEWSETASFITGLTAEEEWQGAQWIGYETLPDSLRVLPGVHGPGDDLGEKGKRRPVIPQFRKEFTVDKPVRQALLFISGLGHYEASLNGEKTGDHFLSPGWTDYHETVLYNTFDLTGKIRQGENLLGAVVGNGFHNINRERYRKLVISYGMPKMISLLKITYEDGTEEIISSGPDWKVSPSPVTYSSIYGGENYDARKEQDGWDLPGFDDSDWKQALVAESPGGRLRPQLSYPNKVRDTLEVKRILEPEPGKYVYDFGQNASGIPRLKVQGEKGQEVKLTPGELLNDNGLVTQSATGSPHYYLYILKGEGTEEWQPQFTYYGFRYIQVEGAAPDTVSTTDKPLLGDLKFLHTRNAAPKTGDFETSDELFNDIYSLIDWAIKSNLQSVVTDCPHREKLGWMEQTHLMGGSIHYNYHLYHLYKKLIYDMIDAQTADGLVPNIAPEYVVFDWGLGFRDSPEWGSASVQLPWRLYRWYGDEQIVEEAWPMMTQYVDYLERKADNHIVSYGLGDWYDLGPEPPGFAQLTPKALTATAIYYHNVDLLSRMAEVIGRPDEADTYRKQSEKIKEAFNERFFDESTNVYATGSQTAMAMPLVIGLAEVDVRGQVFTNLTDSIRANDKALTAGDVGFHYLVKALQEGDASQLIYEMNARDDVPGYGYQLKKGATALTESWAALERVSNNHLMLGHIMEWFYGGLAGIKQSGDSQAYKDVLIEPNIVADIEWTRAWFESPYGKIRSSWSLDGDRGTLDVTIPVNATATVVIPSGKTDQIEESGNPVTNIPGILDIEAEENRVRLRIGSGDYSFNFSYAAD